MNGAIIWRTYWSTATSTRAMKVRGTIDDVVRIAAPGRGLGSPLSDRPRSRRRTSAASDPVRRSTRTLPDLPGRADSARRRHAPAAPSSPCSTACRPAASTSPMTNTRCGPKFVTTRSTRAWRRIAPSFSSHLAPHVLRRPAEGVDIPAPGMVIAPSGRTFTMPLNSGARQHADLHLVPHAEPVGFLFGSGLRGHRSGRGRWNYGNRGRSRGRCPDAGTVGIDQRRKIARILSHRPSRQRE